MKIGIIGTGVFSTSIALNLANNKENNIIMWSENTTLVEEYKKTKKLIPYFNNKTVPKNITITTEYQEVLENIDILFLVTGVEYIKEVCKNIHRILDSQIPVFIGSKGIGKENKKFVHEIAKKYLKNKISIISGPTFAEDVAKIEPLGFTVASKDKKSQLIINKAFEESPIYFEKSNDLTGVAICGCLKNIYAIGSGILKGLNFNESTRSLYFTEIYKELGNILYKYKSSLETLNSLAGLGDLNLTCNSNQSRNYSYGEIIGKKGNKKEAKKYLEENTVEGVDTLQVLYPILKRKHVKCAIVKTLYNIIYNEEEAKKLIEIITKKATN